MIPKGHPRRRGGPSSFDHKFRPLPYLKAYPCHWGTQWGARASIWLSVADRTQSSRFPKPRAQVRLLPGVSPLSTRNPAGVLPGAALAAIALGRARSGRLPKQRPQAQFLSRGHRRASGGIAAHEANPTAVALRVREERRPPHLLGREGALPQGVPAAVQAQRECRMVGRQPDLRGLRHQGGQGGSGTPPRRRNARVGHRYSMML